MAGLSLKPLPLSSNNVSLEKIPMTPIIDIYCHIYPDQFYRRMTEIALNLQNMGSRLRRIKKLFDLDVRFRRNGRIRRLSPDHFLFPDPPIEDIAGPDIGLALCRIAE